MKELELVKSFNFNEVECNIYTKNNEVYMTINQLAEVLGYKDRKGIEKIIERNEYLKNKEFSVTDNLSATDGKKYITRLFTEDGIYEVTMLSKTEVGKKFRRVVREIIKSLRKGESKLIKMTEYQKLTAEAKLNNSRARLAGILMKIADKTNVPEYKQICCSNATAILAGQPLLPLPVAEKRTYSASEIGKILGISPNKVGMITNANNLKTSEYGKLFYDKAKYCNKEIETFRYYENVIPKIKAILEQNM